MANSSMNWVAIDNDPRFQELHTKKSRFLWTLMIVSVIYYFLLPVGAAYFTDLFKVKVWGPVNVGILFALSEFVVAWGIAYYYARTAGRSFDPMADEILRKAGEMGGRK
jgi:uncharacterized membrane protein (DUF485 family)